ncbi:hypothetical protein BDY21DRAFT_198306 [Lineolata rhizophorae]|uniref:Uncharacterized protein n=1 Tax=Lineolata rhizophorae TaxID=578093 RepID=A0A6A6P5F0_9PEZI|nr:hypothetical protein BDY21DRAFT_198306 [Lineolata rhizophorae]
MGGNSDWGNINYDHDDKPENGDDSNSVPVNNEWSAGDDWDRAPASSGATVSSKTAGGVGSTNAKPSKTMGPDAEPANSDGEQNDMPELDKWSSWGPTRFNEIENAVRSKRQGASNDRAAPQKFEPDYSKDATPDPPKGKKTCLCCQDTSLPGSYPDGGDGFPAPHVGDASPDNEADNFYDVATHFNNGPANRNGAGSSALHHEGDAEPTSNQEPERCSCNACDTSPVPPPTCPAEEPRRGHSNNRARDIWYELDEEQREMLSDHVMTRQGLSHTRRFALIATIVTLRDAGASIPFIAMALGKSRDEIEARVKYMEHRDWMLPNGEANDEKMPELYLHCVGDGMLEYPERMLRPAWSMAEEKAYRALKHMHNGGIVPDDVFTEEALEITESIVNSHLRQMWHHAASEVFRVTGIRFHAEELRRKFTRGRNH